MLEGSLLCRQIGVGTPTKSAFATPPTNNTLFEYSTEFLQNFLRFKNSLEKIPRNAKNASVLGNSLKKMRTLVTVYPFSSIFWKKQFYKYILVVKRVRHM